MDLFQKLHILGDSAKYDASCASSGACGSASSSFGNTLRGGVCHSWSSDGRCISLLKILMTNDCIYDCTYCANRTSKDIPRSMFTPAELARLTINFYRKNYIEGLFLSSAVYKSPDFTMCLMIEAVRQLREEHGFGGYIHMKLIPGASIELVDLAGRYADRLSVNIELPTEKSLNMLAPQKKIGSILTPMKQVSTSITHFRKERRKYGKKVPYITNGQSTQLIVGASPEPDLKILRLSEQMYNRYQLKRVYYSAYVPVNSSPLLPVSYKPPLLREHRLYQADWLLRFYGFTSSELLDEGNANFDTEFDPKVSWALRHLEQFPVEINRADYRKLLRIPGIGMRTARKILSMRRVKRVKFEDLQKLRMPLNRARYFILANGKYYGQTEINYHAIRQKMILPRIEWDTQLDLFDQRSDSNEIVAASVTGEF